MAPASDAASERKPLLPALELDATGVLHVEEFVEELVEEACLIRTFSPRVAEIA